MSPSRRLLLLVTLVLLNHFSLARNLPTPSSPWTQSVNHSQTLLRTVNNSLGRDHVVTLSPSRSHNMISLINDQVITNLVTCTVIPHLMESQILGARHTLKDYSCTAEEIDHEDITKDKTSTLKACLPLELVKNESCLASRETSFITTLCLSSIYEDLKMYQMEFKALNAELSKDNPKQIILNEDMLAAIDEMMQALNFSSETLPQQPSLEELDSYKIKMKLCILLHAFSIRTVTISRVMSYLSSS